jgi:pimeloyl-ACP methyl ester carboxylesterase
LPDGAPSINVAQGRDDDTVPYTLWDGIVPRLPRASFHLFDRSGHQPFFEERAEFTARVLAWLEASR